MLMIFLYLPFGQIKSMIVTVNTDASYSNKHKIGSYAFWIVSDKGKIFRSGTLKGSVCSSTHAEMKCILNAFHCLFETEEWNCVTKIIVNTDSMIAIEKFQNNHGKWLSTKKSEFLAESKIIQSCLNRILVDHINKKNNKKKIIIEYRHVKAHQHKKTSRNFVNYMCEKEAKRQLGISLKQFFK